MTIVVPHPAAQRGGRQRLSARGQPSSGPTSRITVPLGSAAAVGYGHVQPAIPQICAPELMAAAEAALDGAFRATFVPDPCSDQACRSSAPCWPPWSSGTGL